MEQRNFERYSTRREALVAFHSLKKRPYWLDGESAFYLAVDFDEWIWLPVNDSQAYPIDFKKKYLGILNEI